MTLIFAAENLQKFRGMPFANCLKLQALIAIAVRLFSWLNIFFKMWPSYFLLGRQKPGFSSGTTLENNASAVHLDMPYYHTIHSLK